MKRRTLGVPATRSARGLNHGTLVPILFAASLLAVGCSDDGVPASETPITEPSPESATAAAPTTTDDTTTTTTAGTDDPGGEVEIEASVDLTLSEHSPLAGTVTIDASVAVTAQLTATSGDHVVTTPVTAAATTSHELPLLGMRADRDYDVDVLLTHASGVTLVETASMTTGPLPDDLPELDIRRDPDRVSPGITMIELSPVIAAMGGAGNPVVGVDDEGEYVWYHNAGTFSGALQRTPTGGVSLQHDPWAFSINDITGRRLAEYYADPAGNDVASVDEAGVEVIPYSADWIELGAVHHDLIVLDDGSILGLATTEHPVSADRRAELCPGDDNEWNIFSDVITHIEPDGTVIRTWDLYDIVSFDDLPGEFLCNQQGLNTTPTRRDWTHANAVWFDEDRDAILVSSRHTDQIVALQMTEETGPVSTVRWILGAQGTIPYTGASFHHTHGVKTISNGDILLYDNGNFRPGSKSAGGDDPDYSRAVRIRVDDSAEDPAAWTATQVWDHRMIDPLTGELLYAPFISDADELENGNILVTHGGAAWDPANFLVSHVHIVEIVPDTDATPVGGDIVWELMLGTEDQPASVYRSDRWPSLYFGPLWSNG